jgi:L-ascorbate metabolism protein UlaG (beta-lactamase superfamily)
MHRKYPQDSIPTSHGDLNITFLGHASLMFTWMGTVVHVDPVSAEADYAALPKANVILVTHEHFDHLDPEAIILLRRPFTEIVHNPESRSKLPGARALKNGQKASIQGLEIEVVPAYNLTGMRAPGVPYHPKGIGNGYILTFADVRVYVAGDTENIPEMKALKNIDAAFLPMMLPYTMSPAMIADAVRAFRPKILYPYHMKDPEAAGLRALLADMPEIDVRFKYGR